MFQRTDIGAETTPQVRDVQAIRGVAGILAGVISIGLVIALTSYFTGGTWQLLFSGVGALVSVLGLVMILIRLRPGTEISHLRTMVYLVLGFLSFDILMHILVFRGIGLYLMGVGVVVLTFIGLLLLPRQWRTYVVVALIFLGAAGLIEWLEPLPRDDISRYPTAGITLPLIFILMGVALISIAIRLARVSNIRYRLLISFIVVTLLPGIMIAVASVTLGLQSAERSVLAGLAGAAEAREAQIVTQVEALEFDLAVLRNLELANLRLLLTSERDSPTFQLVRAVQQQRLQTSLALRGNFDVVFLVSQDGVIVFSTDPAHELRQVTHDVGLSDSLAEGSQGVWTGPVASSSLLNRLVVTVAMPVVDETGAPLGVMMGQADVVRMSKVMADRSGLGEHHEVYLLNPEGRIVLAAPVLDSEGSGGIPGEVGTPGEVLSSDGIDALLVARRSQRGRYLNHRGEPVLGAYHWIPGLELGLVVEAPARELVQATVASVGVNVVLIVLSVGVAIAGSFFIANGIARPLLQVAETASLIAEGDLSRTIPVARDDEIGQMARAVNEMTQRLRELVGSLEERVAQRTRVLERQSAQLQTAARVARLAASIREIDELLQVAAAQIAEQFGFYHVGIYLASDAGPTPSAGRSLLLRAASGGEALLKQGFRLDLHASADRFGGEGRGVIVDVARTGRAAIVADVSQDRRYLAVPELPETRSEMSLPLRVRDEVIGVLDVQSAERGAFSDSDTTYLQTLADQLGLAIENARLLSEAEQRLQEIGRLLQVQRYEGWREMLSPWTGGTPSYFYDGVETRVGGEDQIKAAPDLELPLGGTFPGGPEAMDASSLGMVRVKLGQGRQLSPVDEAVAGAIVAEASQALERARLFGGTRRALLEADTLYRCGRAMVEATRLDEILATLADYVVAPGIDRMALLRLHTSSGSDPGAEGAPVMVEVASVWPEPLEASKLAGSSEPRAGARWALDHLPVLAQSVEQDTRAVESVVIEDVAAPEALDAASRAMLLDALGMRSVLILPLRSGSQSGENAHDIGWLLVGARQSLYAFSAQEIRIYQGVADQAATVARNIELLTLAQQQADRERVIASIGDNIRRFTDVETILQTSVRELGRALRASDGVIRLHPGAAATEPARAPEAGLDPADQAGLHEDDAPVRLQTPAAEDQDV